MGTGHEIWQVKGTQRARVWAVDNIKVDLQGLEWQSQDFAQDRERWRDF